MEKEKSQKIQIDFLLADFNSIKAEMSQRAGLQKTAHLLYLAGIAWIFTKTTAGESSGFYIIFSWFISAIAMIFIYREGLEIGRLGKMIREQICTELKEITHIDAGKLIPSENVVVRNDKTWIKRLFLSECFNGVVFIGVPLTITIIYFAR